MSHYSKLKETKVSSKTLYKGVVGFNKDTVRLINGRETTRVYLAHRGASAILPLTDDGQIYLVQQYRYPVDKVTWEIPAGKREQGQTPLSCAKAELAQETGLHAAKWKKLAVFNPSNAFSTEFLHIYLAAGLKRGKDCPDEDEFLNVKKFPLEKVYGMIKSGKIQDAKTIIGLLMYRSFYESRRGL